MPRTHRRAVRSGRVRSMVRTWMRRHVAPLSPTVVLALAATLALTSAFLVLFWPERGTRSATPAGAAAADPYEAVMPGLCRSFAAAMSGDVPGAERVFDDTVHGPLHDIAREAAGVDRYKAALVLEAKETLERHFEGSQPDPTLLVRDLARLRATTSAALALTGHPSGDVCESGP